MAQRRKKTEPQSEVKPERVVLPPVQVLPGPSEQQWLVMVLAAGGEVRVSPTAAVEADKYRLMWFTDHATGEQVVRAVAKETAEASAIALEDAKAGEPVAVMLEEKQLNALRGIR